MTLIPIVLVLSSVSLAGCVTSGGARMGLFSATAPVIGMLADDLLVGSAKGYLDRTGTIDVKSSVRADVRCVGEFKYTGSKTGRGELHCNDGNVAEFQFNALSSLSGYGYGHSAAGPFSFTFGLTPEDSAKYLKLPAGKRLERDGDSAKLIET